MKEIIRQNFKVKLVETEEELYKVRRLRYEDTATLRLLRLKNLLRKRTAIATI